nr:tigger transposable element-derived protein 4-like [Hydra vulgaris]
MEKRNNVLKQYQVEVKMLLINLPLLGFLPTIFSRYNSHDTFNADEFGLFYKTLPKKIMHLKGEKCSGGKNCKIGLTGLAAANMCAEKLPMFVIGKSNKPRCFKGIRSTQCCNHAQKQSLMTSELFEEWVRENDRKFELEVRKVLRPYLLRP